MIDPLTTLAIRHGTDKFGFHDYTPNYHALFAPYRDRPVRLLEIGVGGYADADRGGQSLATWRDYFPDGQITGIDIQPKAIPLGDRVAILRGSQVDAAFLARVVAERGPFDLIVDDGSHRNEHVVETFGLLFPTLAPGGTYVVEDVQTAFMPRFGGSLALEAPNSVGHFREMLGAAGQGDVAAVERFHNMVAVRKAGGDPLPPLPEPDATLGGDAGELEVRAAFATLAEPGALRIAAPLGVEAAALVRHLFVQVDHREIAVAHPTAPVDPMARHLASVVVDAAGARLVKGPNDYPSNFAFDADHPQVRTAMAEIEAALADCEDENGLVQYATLLTTTRGREAAGPWVARMVATGATSRTFHHLASGLALREKRMDEALRLFEGGVARYPDDATLIQGLAGVLLARGDGERARAVTAAGLARAPRDVTLHGLMVRVAQRLGEHDVAVDHARQALAMSAPARRVGALTALGEAYAGAGRWPEAEATLTDALAAPGRYAGRAWKGLAQARAARGDAAGAREATDKALALSSQAGEDQGRRAPLPA